MIRKWKMTLQIPVSSNELQDASTGG